RRLSRGVDPLPEARDQDLDQVARYLGITPAQVLDQLLLGEDVAAPIGQELQQRVLARRQVQRAAVPRNLASGGVDGQGPQADDRALRLVAPADEGLDARTQLVEGERLDEVVVGSQLEPLDPVLDAVAG